MPKNALFNRVSKILHLSYSYIWPYFIPSTIIVLIVTVGLPSTGASVVVAGSGRAGTSGMGAGGGVSGGVVGMCGGVAGGAEDDSNISLLLCEETIPGSPAPDAEPAPPRHKHTLPFACAPPHHSHSKG